MHVEAMNEAPHLERLATLGELAGPLAHETANFLNVLLLEVALLEERLPEEFVADLAEVRRQGKALAAILEQYQTYRKTATSAPGRADLAEATREAAADLGDAVALQGDRLPAGVALAVPASDLRRLVRFLGQNMARLAEEAGGGVALRAEARDGRVLLSASLPRHPSRDPVEDLFEPARQTWPVVNKLELSACQSMARRFGGAAWAERQGNTLVLLVDLPAEAEA